MRAAQLCSPTRHRPCFQAWQLELAAGATNAPIAVVPNADGEVSVELYVDKQICEAFASDATGPGFAVATFGCLPASTAATGVAFYPTAMGGAKLKGSLSDIAGSILPPPGV